MIEYRRIIYNIANKKTHPEHFFFEMLENYVRIRGGTGGLTGGRFVASMGAFGCS
jgi:hypothetical protein